jgi:tRNA A-37 threonylcarbamoyl transferase component Bud32
MSEILGQRYLLGEKIGEGGAASVFRAMDQRLGVERAVKVVQAPAGPRRDQLRRRLRAEARTMASLGHPHVLQIHDVGQEGDRDYVVMELAAGGSAWDRLKGEDPPGPEQVLGWTVQVLTALEAAHAAGIVHRDVKPHNILLDQRGRAMLADFGIALVVRDEGRTTRTGVAMGSLAFMAPEQRLDARGVGPAADLYSVGATLYQLVTGANPIDLFTVAEGSGRMSLLPAELRPIVTRATRLDAASRYPDAASMRRDLEAVAASTLSLPAPIEVSEHPPTAGPDTLPLPRTEALPVTERLGPPPEPPLRVGRVMGALLAASAITVGLAWWVYTPPSAPPAEVVEVPEAAPVEVGLEVRQPAPVQLEPAAPEVARPEPSRVAGAPPAPRPSSAGPSPQGRWRMDFDTLVYELELSGSDEALVGSIELEDLHTSTKESYVVRARYEPESRVLTVTPETRKAPQVTATLSQDLSRFEGWCRLPATETRCEGRRL